MATLATASVQEWRAPRVLNKPLYAYGSCNLQPAIDTDQVPLCLACKDTPLQIGDDTSITERAGMINSTHVKVAARPFAACCHPVSAHDGFQSHEDTANDH
jgi:hypothetical protein